MKRGIAVTEGEERKSRRASVMRRRHTEDAGEKILGAGNKGDTDTASDSDYDTERHTKVQTERMRRREQEVGKVTDRQCICPLDRKTRMTDAPADLRAWTGDSSRSCNHRIANDVQSQPQMSARMHGESTSGSGNPLILPASGDSRQRHSSPAFRRILHRHIRTFVRLPTSTSLSKEHSRMASTRARDL